jgi:hypothetical protein
MKNKNTINIRDEKKWNVKKRRRKTLRFFSFPVIV